MRQLAIFLRNDNELVLNGLADRSGNLLADGIVTGTLCRPDGSPVLRNIPFDVEAAGVYVCRIPSSFPSASGKTYTLIISGDAAGRHVEVSASIVMTPRMVPIV